VTEYLAGKMVAADAPFLEGLEKRTVSGGQFAVFECPVEAIGESYRHIFQEWLPNTDVQLDPAVPVFEEYPESTSQRPVRVHVPVRQPPDEGGNAGYTVLQLTIYLVTARACERSEPSQLQAANNVRPTEMRLVTIKRVASVHQP